MVRVETSESAGRQKKKKKGGQGFSPAACTVLSRALNQSRQFLHNQHDADAQTRGCWDDGKCLGSKKKKKARTTLKHDVLSKIINTKIYIPDGALCSFCKPKPTRSLRRRFRRWNWRHLVENPAKNSVFSWPNSVFHVSWFSVVMHNALSAPSPWCVCVCCSCRL